MSPTGWAEGLPGRKECSGVTVLCASVWDWLPQEPAGRYGR